MENFTRMTFPASKLVIPQVTEQVLKLLSVSDSIGSTGTELMAMMGIPATRP
ncbi:hypothetical protein SAMN05216436_12953, partial [bacterium A37T11]